MSTAANEKPCPFCQTESPTYSSFIFHKLKWEQSRVIQERYECYRCPKCGHEFTLKASETEVGWLVKGTIRKKLPLRDRIMRTLKAWL